MQLALAGSCGYPVLEDLSNDEHFHGTVIASIVPVMMFVPAGPPLARSTDAVHRYHG
ncbi:MAG: hypothetical protein H0X34_17070 [Chthoniobacterales bacterium]|nr:hypothetical protein [Chthoniobacterales bacterium]